MPLTDVTTLPNALGSVLRDAHTTGAHALARFSDLPYADPALLEAASRLERDAARACRQR